MGRAVLGRATAMGLGWTWLRHLPRLPIARTPPAPWPRDPPWQTPADLRTVPGVWRDEQAADAAYAERPVYSFFRLYPEGFSLVPRYGWAWQLLSLPRMMRMSRKAAEVTAAARRLPEPPPDPDPEELTEALRAEAARLGLSEVGFAPFDPRYVFDRVAADGPSSTLSEGSVVVCLLEQSAELTQTIPSAKCERGVMRTYSELVDRVAVLAQLLQRRGFRTEIHGLGGSLISIHYAVEAGLGQLGLNGQLLTPRVGSRCRIALITTNATLVHGQPVDYGIHAICDRCRVCVRRCPPGAIPVRRKEHRGVTKAKIKPERCLPTVTQAHGCAICMKVCPVQRHGLQAVTDHLLETGEILGKGTDDLEGYDWIDGRHYGPGRKPPITRDFITPMGVGIDRARTEPPSEPGAGTAFPFKQPEGSELMA
jgi:ferredoxin